VVFSNTVSVNPSISLKEEFSVTIVVVGLVPSVWITLVRSAKKSGSFTSISETTLPIGTSTDQFPLASV